MPSLLFPSRTCAATLLYTVDATTEMQVAEITVRCLRDIDAIDAAIQAEGLCEVQSSLLTTMSYIYFKRLCRDALAGRPCSHDTKLLRYYHYR